MPTIVRIETETFAPLAGLAGLVAMAGGHETVLVGAHHTMTDGQLPALREALTPHRLVALLVDDHVPDCERTVIENLLDNGDVPVILSSCDPPPAELTSWLHPARQS